MDIKEIKSNLKMENLYSLRVNTPPLAAKKFISNLLTGSG